MNEVPESLEFNQIFHGMIAKDFITAFNSDFNIADTQLIYLLGQMIYCIKSSEVKELRLKNGVLEYTINGTDWLSVDSTAWGNIKGNITDQSDLKEALDLKAAVSTVDTLRNLVNTIDKNLSSLTKEIEDAEININDNANNITSLNNKLLEKVSSTTIKEIRISNDAFQWSPDGINWYQHETVSSLDWGDITGDITQQSDLYQMLTSLEKDIENLTSTSAGFSESITRINNSLDELKVKVNTSEAGIESLNENLTEAKEDINNIKISKANSEDLSNHVNNHENPHAVTKNQVGLGNVDNTADIDKPVSNPQAAHITDAINGLKEDIGSNNLVHNKGNLPYIAIMNSASYEASVSELTNTLVFVNDNIVFEETANTEEVA